MSRLRFLPMFVFLCAAVFVSALSAQDIVRSKKLIQLGWDIPNTAYLKQHHGEMQRSSPFDGVMLALDVTAPDGKRYSSQTMMTAQPWDSAWFATAIEDLKACRWTTFTDNFIRVNFTPGEIDWNNDKGWEIFCSKTAICAQIAKEAGLKGLSIDFEPYGKAIFMYSSDSGLSFSEMKQIVRKRGRQWMEAIASKYPDMVLFTLFIGQVNMSAGLDFQPDSILKQRHYGLLPAFFDGMLDAIPPKMSVVDGCEDGYVLNGTDEFNRLALAIQSIGGPAIRLVSPENREKYIRQVRVGFGFYLDMYTNPEGVHYYRGPREGGTRLDRLEENLSAAVAATDEYVWIYGEHRHWWKPNVPNEKAQHWEEAMPGMVQALRFTKNPRDAAKQKLETLRKENRVVNLLKNPEFAESKIVKKQIDDKEVEVLLPANWSTWQDKPLGTFSWDGETNGGSAKATGVKWGCYMQSFNPVKPSEYYYVAIDARQQGTGQIKMGIRWNNAKGEWTRESEDRIFSFEKDLPLIDNRPLPDGWMRAEGIVRIPEGVAVLQVQAGIRDQTTADDAAWFDNAALIRLR
ncbi:MAG: hypothetical protein FWE67_08745 [Planctomycetaceae bacterium]|nr:hypothetical protein [Planctomycetaceae bacterium]